MRYLLDTHAVIWLKENNPRLDRTKWEPVLFSADNEVFVSIVSLWEITIKKNLGKLDFKGEIEEFAATPGSVQGFRILPVEPTHLGRVGTATRLQGCNTKKIVSLDMRQEHRTFNIELRNLTGAMGRGNMSRRCGGW